MEIAAASPGGAEEAAVRAFLAAFNEEAGWPHAPVPLVLTLRDEAGQVHGGLVGQMNWRWLWVQNLALGPAARGRGWGTRLLAEAEARARAAGCIGVRLDTYAFQARGFYEKRGYALAGMIPDCPPGAVRYTMFRRLDGAQGEA